MSIRLIVIIFLFAVISCGKSHFSLIDIVSYDTKVSYDTLSKHLLVKTTIQFNLMKKNDKTVKLIFTNLANITKINITDNNSYFPVSYTYHDDKISFNLPNQLQDKNKLYLNLEYQLPLEYYSNSRFVRLLRTHNWCPFQYNDMSDSRIIVETPLNYIAYSSGQIIEDTSKTSHSYYTWENTNYFGFLLIIAPKNFYSVITKNIDNREIYFYFSNMDSTIANDVTNEFCSSFHYFNLLFGKYRHKKLRIFEIPDDDFYAMSSTTSIVYSQIILRFNLRNHKNIIFERNEDSLNHNISMDSSFDDIKKYKYRDSYSGIKFEGEDKFIKDTNRYSSKVVVLDWISHEVAHLWVGGGFFIEFNSKLTKFMEEGLAEYARYMYIEDKYGIDSLNSVIKDTKAKIENLIIINPADDIPLSSNSSSSAMPYIKGPLVFHYLRNQIGKDNWIKFLRSLYNKYYGRTIDYKIFRKELSKFDIDGTTIKKMEEMTEMKGVLPL